jgi:predicted homoserine dehydrogenase-like protein
VLITVVVGNVIVDDSKLAPHVIALAVPLSVIEIHNVCPIVGVPLKLVVNDVIAAAKAVIE